MFQVAIDFFLDLLFPQHCLRCKQEGAVLCGRCESLLPNQSSICFVCDRRSPDGSVCKACRHETRLRRFIAPLPYHDPLVRELIHAFKYSLVREVAEVLTQRIVRYILAVKLEIPERTLVAPIPLHRARERERGFNQAEILARHLAKALNLPLENALLKRRFYATPQTKIRTREARLANARGLYVMNARLPKKTTVILVDDVSTTGATLEEAATILKQAGAKQVWAITAAR